ncbi:hypothetical protein CRYUN_Cryun19dG0043000 [Craigia yunnanensis]
MNPGLRFAIGKKARDLLYKDYAQQQPRQLRYQSFDWSFDFSCQIEEILPGLNTVFRVIIPDSGKELQYLRDYVGFSAGVGLKANPSTGFDPIANISGVIGSTIVSFGADLGIDITTRTLNKFSTGLSLNSAFLIASLTLLVWILVGKLVLFFGNKCGKGSVSIAGEMDLRDSNNIPRIELSMALKPQNNSSY